MGQKAEISGMSRLDIVTNETSTLKLKYKLASEIKVSSSYFTVIKTFDMT